MENLIKQLIFEQQKTNTLITMLANVLIDEMMAGGNILVCFNVEDLIGLQRKFHQVSEGTYAESL